MIDIDSILTWLRSVTPDEVKVLYHYAADLYGNPWFYGGIAALLLVERIRPAIKQQKVFSKGFFEDFLWFNLSIAFAVAVLPLIVGYSTVAYNKVTGGFRLPLGSSLPLGWKVGISLLLYDFLQWLHHWVKHKVPWFWDIHLIHHSQRELNLFTSMRAHTFEYLIAHVVTFVPIFILQLTPAAILWVALAIRWHLRIVHANWKTNLGPLKHVFVTPQYHRIHHSLEERHFDKNYAVVFTIWDRVFGTIHRNYDEYPETGVVGVEFERPAGFSPVAWGRTIWLQFVYPFQQIPVRRRKRRPPAQPEPAAQPVEPAAPRVPTLTG